MKTKTKNGKLKILSHSDDPFTDRVEAGELLAEVLIDHAGSQTVILGIPRGGLVVAREVARRLKAPLDIVLARKLGAPQNPELAIGAITEEGEVFLDEPLARRVGASEDYLQQESRSQLQEIQRRSSVYRNIRPKIDLRDKDVIVVDDGVATGSTVQAALWSIAREKPHKITGAFPVGAEDSLLRLCDTADEIICLKAPPSLGAIGNFYLHFRQVSDQEALEILNRA